MGDATSTPPPTTAAITIGTFDGVHVGHQALVRACREFASAQPVATRVVALAFDPHPMTTLRPERAPPRLTNFDRKEALLRAAGADEVVRLSPTPAMLSQTAQEFVAGLLARFSPRLIVEGGDFHFGKDRAGSVQTLRTLAAAQGCAVLEVPAVEVELLDQTTVRASSTLARVLVGGGRVQDAAIVLGRPYELSGTVARGDQLGRTIGLPTCNLALDGAPHDCCLMPANGVYAGQGVLPSGAVLPAAINIGERPTVGGMTLRIEALLLDAAGGVARIPVELNSYGWPLTLRLDRFLRDQVRFPSLEALRAQIARDAARIASLAR